MIYTLTLNPALDYVLRAEEFCEGGLIRTTEERYLAGGKGICESAVLTNLGVPNTALGFIGGFTGEKVEELVKAAGIRCDFVRLRNGETRINVKLKTGRETEINARGPAVSEEDISALFEKTDKIKDGDVLTLCGTAPKSVGDDFYCRIMERLSGRDIKTAVDTSGEALKKTLSYAPFLIKPNKHELGELIGAEPQNNDEVINGARRLQRLGARNVLVSLAREGAVLVTEDGRVYERKAPPGTVKNSTGAGDSMVAGFLAGYEETRDMEYAFKLGIAAGTASAFSDELAKKAEIDALMKSM